MNPRLIALSASRLIDRLDGLLDAAIPVAVSLLCFDQRTPAFLTLLVWLILRLVQQVPRYPLALIFLLLLGAQAGQFVLERDLQPSSASDPFVIGLGFVAMVGRSSRQWRSTLGWIALSLIPLAIWALGQDPSLPLDLPVGGLNRLGFLLGLLQLSAWASAWLSTSLWSRCACIGLVVLAMPMTLHNGSRVAFFAPLVALILASCSALLLLRPRPDLAEPWLCMMRWRRSLLSGALLASLLISAFVVWQWYFSPATLSQLNGLSDRGRFETAACWAHQPLKRGGEKFLLGLGYNQAVQKRCTGKQLQALRVMKRPSGLPHAHNLFAQIFAENGILGLVSLSLVLVLSFWRLWLSLRRESAAGVCDLAFLYSLPVVLYLLFNGFVSSFQIFLMSNQLLIGASLASLWPPKSWRSS